MTGSAAKLAGRDHYFNDEIRQVRASVRPIRMQRAIAAMARHRAAHIAIFMGSRGRVASARRAARAEEKMRDGHYLATDFAARRPHILPR